MLNLPEIALGRAGETTARGFRAPLARRPGRPSGLDDARVARFFEAIEVGVRPTPAARLAGISVDTLSGWLKRGRGLDPCRPAKPEYVRFVEMVERFEAQAEFEVVKNLVADLKGHPGAAIRWLEARWPERYGRSRREPAEDDHYEAALSRPAEPEIAVVANEPPRRRLVIPLDRLGDLADRIMLFERGVQVAPSLAGLSIGPDDEFDSEIAQ